MTYSQVIFFGLSLIGYSSSYTIYTLDDPHECNQSIYLGQGQHSAAILKLTSRESYVTTPLFCTISFKVPIHNWSGLTGVLEDVDMRKYEDSNGQHICVDHITVVTEKHNLAPSVQQCGSWSVTPGQALSKQGINRALFDYCPHSVSWGNTENCHVTELKVIVSIGNEKRSDLWRNHTWNPHRGFTFVVTAYSYPIKNGESECRDGLRSCSQANTPGSRLGVYHCIHDSLWCDAHVNCGLLENMDEIACFRKGIWSGLITVVIGPWMGTSMFLLLIFCGVLYWRSSRLRVNREAQSTNQELNSYAESYELSSNLTSAHHMAIQVRVVCNSNHSHHGNRLHQPWKNDLPPSYEALFPQGPPQPYPSVPSSSGQNVTASIVANVTGNSVSTISSVGVDVSSMTSQPLTVVTTTGTSTHPVIQPSITSNSAEMSSQQLVMSPSICSNDIASIIDLNVTRNNVQPTRHGIPNKICNPPSMDAKFVADNNQASVALTLAPSHLVENSDYLIFSSETQVIHSGETTSSSTDVSTRNTNITDESEDTVQMTNIDSVSTLSASNNNENEIISAR